MSTQSTAKPSLRHRATEEFTVLFALTLYLYICFGAVLLLKTSILRDAGISYTAWGAAAIKAVVLAKFMMIGRAMGLAKRYEHLPLIWPTLHKALTFLVLLLVLSTIEEITVGLIHSRPVDDSLQHVVGPIFFEGIAVSFVMFLILVPYCAFQSLGAVMGEGKLARLFFISRDDQTP
jgi:Na+-translocating ferredoxin:NAD+ oxidoreductase RnfE subunit